MANDFGTKMVAAWNSGNVDQIVDCYAPSAVMHHPLVPVPLEGREAIRAFEAPMFSAFSELGWKCLKVTGSGDEVALEFEIRARNTAPMQTPKGPVPATNRKITLRACSVVKLDGDGRIVEERRYFDSGSLFVQLGLGG